MSPEYMDLSGSPSMIAEFCLGSCEREEQAAETRGSQCGTMRGAQQVGGTQKRRG
jgi:hypothetical protein